MGVLEWEGSRVLFQSIRFNVGRLWGIVSRLVEKARRDSMELLRLEVDGEAKKRKEKNEGKGEEGRSAPALPSIIRRG